MPNRAAIVACWWTAHWSVSGPLIVEALDVLSDEPARVGPGGGRGRAGDQRQRAEHAKPADAVESARSVERGLDPGG
jgi:hypothetical protein